MSKLKKIGLIVIIIGVLCIVFNMNKAYAASSVTLSASKTSATVGDSITITANVTSGAWNLTLSAGGENKGLVGQTNTTANASASTSITFTANEAKTYVATLTGDVTDYDTSTTEDVNKTVSIVVTAPEPTPTPNPEPEPTPTPTKSSDTSLKSLSIAPFGTVKKASSGIYDITIDNKYDKVTINANPNNSAAKIVSGNGEFSLVEGSNNLKVVVKAEDGTEATHKIRIIRKAAETVEPITPPNVIDNTKKEEIKQEEEVPTDELFIENLVITGIDLNPKFSKDIFEYTAEFSGDSDSLEIIATPNVEGANVEIVGNTNLKIGENLITIIVKSADENTKKTYQITVNKKEVEAVEAISNTIGTTDITTTTSNEELKNKVGKIILIAAAAVIAVIIIGIIAISNTRKVNYDENIIGDKLKEKKKDFKSSFSEDDSYRELEKLANIHNENEVQNMEPPVQNIEDLFSKDDSKKEDFDLIEKEENNKAEENEYLNTFVPVKDKANTSIDNDFLSKFDSENSTDEIKEKRRLKGKRFR